MADSYAETLEAQMLAEYVAGGMSLAKAMRTLGLPSSTTYKRMDEDPDFDALIEQAKRRGTDAIADQCLEIADDDSQDVGQRGMLNKEFVQRSKLRIETRLKLIAKWNHKKYGEKLEIESKTASVAVPVGDDPLAAVRAYEALLKGA